MTLYCCPATMDATGCESSSHLWPLLDLARRDSPDSPEPSLTQVTLMSWLFSASLCVFFLIAPFFAPAPPDCRLLVYHNSAGETYFSCVGSCSGGASCTTTAYANGVVKCLCDGVENTAVCSGVYQGFLIGLVCNAAFACPSPPLGTTCKRNPDNLGFPDPGYPPMFMAACRCN